MGRVTGTVATTGGGGTGFGVGALATGAGGAAGALVAEVVGVDSPRNQRTGLLHLVTGLVQAEGSIRCQNPLRGLDASVEFPPSLVVSGLDPVVLIPTDSLSSCGFLAPGGAGMG